MNQETNPTMNGPINLGNVMSQAAQVTQQADEGGSDNLKLIYPQQGTLKVRLLYNEPSQVVLRKFERHKIGDKNITCLSNYGMDCPICKVIDDISNAKGLDMWKLKRTTRGIAYAEYVDSDYKFDNSQNTPSKGEIILLMFPWTVYQEINRCINSAGDQVHSLIASNVGRLFKITRWTENKQVKYKAEIDPFEQGHQTRPTDEEYWKLLRELPSLNEKFVPTEINDKIINAAKATADELNREYLSPNVYQPNVGQAGSNMGQAVGGYNPSANVSTPAPTPVAQPATPPIPQQPQIYTDPATGLSYQMINGSWVPMPTQPAPAAPATPAVTPNVPPVGNSNMPACFGRHGDSSINPNNCLMCPSEATCSAQSGGR